VQDMADQEDVRRIALALPDVTADGSGLGYSVSGKGFAWTYPERVHPKKARLPNPEVLVVRVANEGEKQALLASDPDKFFTTDHYNGYPAVLVRLAAVDPDELAELMTDSWRTKAPRHLVVEFDATPR
jgi:hypothetical protein